MKKRFVLIGLSLMLASCLHAQKENYQSTLLTLCDALLRTQINDAINPNNGALVCPSTNPDNHPVHSRAAEAMYPFAVAYKLTRKASYRTAAIRLGNWLTTIQDSTGRMSGGWSENWPDPQQKGWYGTTTDQLISMAGAYQILRTYLKAAEQRKWYASMVHAADFIVQHFPMGHNINYDITGAATLLFTYQTLENPKQSWRIKADSLMTNALLHVDAQNFLQGEGNGVDEGYNLAQSIGYIALYAILKNDTAIKQKAVNLLKTHEIFLYPNGSVDNSWGTRSFKWEYESGTKTAPGVYFSFALLADQSPEFETAAIQCLHYLNTDCIKDGWIIYGPHASRHASSSPPCNYLNFARAQSLALAIEFGTKANSRAPFPAQKSHWYHFFPDLKLAIVRTEKLMATVSAYGETGVYPRASVCRGGSITNLWYEGFGRNGFLQSSSVSSYKRTEALHMPVERELLPLTPRIEFGDSMKYCNLFEDAGTMTVREYNNHIDVETSGALKSIEGKSANIGYRLLHQFYDSYLIKQVTVNGPGQYQIVEPIVRDSGTKFEMESDSIVHIKTIQQNWMLKVIQSTSPYKIILGNDVEKYWCPFPSVEAFPITLSFASGSNFPQTVTIMICKEDNVGGRKP